MFVFRKICRALFSRNTRFEIRPFALLPTSFSFTKVLLKQLKRLKDAASGTAIHRCSIE